MLHNLEVQLFYIVFFFLRLSLIMNFNFFKILNVNFPLNSVFILH
jgi:hypothetical protein